MRLLSKDILKAFIKQRGLSYSQIGNMVDCHRSMISQLANGHRTTCTQELGERIARVLNVPTEALFVSNPSALSGRNVQRREKVA